jgi:hypothetical protein
MKTLPTLVASLVLSLMLAGQAIAQKHTLPYDEMNQALQMKIDKQVIYLSADEPGLLEKSLFSLPLEQEQMQNNQPDVYSDPDCLCHLITRVM